MIEIDLKIRHFFGGGVYAKQMSLPAGHYAISHKHNYDHLSILASGSAIVTTDDGANRYEAPACITIKADLNHRIDAIEDTVWYCIHKTDETDPEHVDEVLIK